MAVVQIQVHKWTGIDASGNVTLTPALSTDGTSLIAVIEADPNFSHGFGSNHDKTKSRVLVFFIGSGVHQLCGPSNSGVYGKLPTGWMVFPGL